MGEKMPTIEREVDELQYKVSELERQCDELKASLKGALGRIRLLELKVPRHDE